MRLHILPVFLGLIVFGASGLQAQTSGHGHISTPNFPVEWDTTWADESTGGDSKTTPTDPYEKCIKACQAQYDKDVAKYTGMDPLAAGVVMEAARKKQDACFCGCAAKYDL